MGLYVLKIQVIGSYREKCVKAKDNDYFIQLCNIISNDCFFKKSLDAKGPIQKNWKQSQMTSFFNNMIKEFCNKIQPLFFTCTEAQQKMVFLVQGNQVNSNMSRKLEA